LTQKVNKKVKAMPASLKKTGVHRRKSPKLVLSYRRKLQTRTILASLHLFFGSPDNAAPICMSKMHKNGTELFL
jgi:hypothetical protein